MSPTSPTPSKVKGILTPIGMLSPQPFQCQTERDSTLLFSPPTGKQNKENRTRMSCLMTPSGLPTVQEHSDQVPWCQTPQREMADMTDDDVQELGEKMHKMGLISSPTPPGLKDVSRMPPPSVKNTFVHYQFESPSKTTSSDLKSPQSVPPYLKLAGLGLSDPIDRIPLQQLSLFGESPNYWRTEDPPSVPSFPRVPLKPPSWDLAFGEDSGGLLSNPSIEGMLEQILEMPDSPPVAKDGSSQQQAGTPLRIADYINFSEPSAAATTTAKAAAPPATMPSACTPEQSSRGTPVRISDYMPDISTVAQLGVQHGFEHMQKLMNAAASGPPPAPMPAPVQPSDGMNYGYGAPDYSYNYTPQLDVHGMNYDQQLQYGYPQAQPWAPPQAMGYPDAHAPPQAPLHQQPPPPYPHVQAPPPLPMHPPVMQQPPLQPVGMPPAQAPADPTHHVQPVMPQMPYMPPPQQLQVQQPQVQPAQALNILEALDPWQPPCSPPKYSVS
eukprot:TRINITY_DN1937_c0_g1_i1.p1 TRINITY_DN1937_c0_g1~~TRINITY_DN1937_c0_g1_i1.p1  ORF type:complete len:569 (-),score=122.83 TRINITY_DN1937_c0_g1_i1:240-1730(-)